MLLVTRRANTKYFQTTVDKSLRLLLLASNSFWHIFNEPNLLLWKEIVKKINIKWSNFCLMYKTGKLIQILSHIYRLNGIKSPGIIIKCYIYIFYSIKFFTLILFSNIILMEILWNICIHLNCWITLLAWTLHLSGNVMDYINIKRMETYIEISFFTDCCNAVCSFKSFKYMQSSLTTST